MEQVNAIFSVAILIMSVVIHEFAHGYTAWHYGDETAHSLGRLTLNPFKHLDLFGSVLIPFILIVTHAPFVFGWAKPVPYNPDNMRNPRVSVPLTALAGVIANISIAILFGILFRVGPMLGIVSSGFYAIVSTIVLINLVLGLFNLMPVPPLDGARVLFALLPPRFRTLELQLERFALPILILFVVFAWQLFTPFLLFLYSLLTGSIL